MQLKARRSDGATAHETRRAPRRSRPDVGTPLLHDRGGVDCWLQVRYPRPTRKHTMRNRSLQIVLANLNTLNPRPGGVRAS